MVIVFASWNSKKCEELKQMTPDGVELICLRDIPEVKGIPQADENGETFLDNAIIKAKYWAEILQMPVIAEDSGIEIDALDGYPGVHTKRCMEELCPGADINVDSPGELYPILLDLMESSENPSKAAKWVSVMSYYNGKYVYSAQYSLPGEMCECRGTREFGFDQYFKPRDMDCTLSELSLTEKNKISPRFNTFMNIMDQLDKM